VNETALVAGVMAAVLTIQKHNVQNIKNIDAIGFIDKDYLHLKDDFNILENGKIVTTMYRDMEIDLLHTPALKKLLEEKASSSKWTCEIQIVNDI
jgi:N-dimethylarginine dimethylaminohydrolase